MNFQDRLTGTKKKTRTIYCKNPLCQVNKPLSKNSNKRTLNSVSCLLDQHSEKQLFYICSECGYYDCSNFGRPVINGPPINLKTFIIPDSFKKTYSKLIEPRGLQKCIFCNLDKIVNFHSEYSHKSTIEAKQNELKLDLLEKEKEDLEKEIKQLKKTSKPVYEIMPCIFKLFTKKPTRRNYIGYLCLACKAIYYDPNFKEIEWERISKQYNEIFEDKTINPFTAWNEIYQQKLKMQKRKTDGEIEIQELETWKSLKIKKPPEVQEEISVKYLGPRHTLSGWDTARPERFSITFDNLTLRKLKSAIKDYGSEQQKQQSKQFGYL